MFRTVLAALTLLWWLGGCSRPDAGISENYILEDLRRYPQDATAYAGNIVPKSDLLSVQKRLEHYWFAPWHYSEAPEHLEAVQWPFRVYSQGASYGENLRRLPDTWFETMERRANFSRYDSVRRYAVALRPLNLRNFPTARPLFRDPERAGEGFPFDYLQNSSVHPNEPLYVSHYSESGAWVYLFSAYATGWVPAHEIAFISPEHTRRWMAGKQVYVLREVPLHDDTGNFLFRARIGMILPLVAQTETGVRVLTATDGEGDQARYVTAELPADAVSMEPLLLNQETLPQIANRLMASHYGWGGMFNERDCSSTLRDLFTPFGIWLPRNSSQQAGRGRVINLAALDDAEKLETIQKEGVPFETLLYRKGHILLYLGTYEGEVMVMHNTWGVKTHDGEASERHIVGRTVISTLLLGSDLEAYDAPNGLLPNLKSMNIITAVAKAKETKEEAPSP